MEIDVNSLSQADRYKLLIGGIVPRPIAFVSTLSPDGRPNLAPFSFFAGVSSEPMALLFCPANNERGEPKDTLRNLLAGATAGDTEHAGGEFVVNTVSESFARRMAACAEPLEYGESEFELSGLTMAASRVVKPARVAESLLSFECRVMKVLRLAPGVPSGGNIVIGRVLHVHAADGLVNERMHVDPARLGAIGRMGGLGYVKTSDASQRFEMPMGRGALEGRAADREGGGKNAAADQRR